MKKQLQFNLGLLLWGLSNLLNFWYLKMPTFCRQDGGMAGYFITLTMYYYTENKFLTGQQ